MPFHVAVYFILYKVFHPVGAQVRAHGEEVPAIAQVDAGTVRVTLRRAIRGVAPGQSIVLYQGTRVLGSATIAQATRS